MRTLRDGLLRRMVFDLGPLEGGTVLVAGSARSGTTWVADQLVSALGARMVFEPFVAAGAGLATNPDRWVRLEYSHYLAPGAADPAWGGIVERVMSGSLVHDWPMLPVQPGIYRRRVVKAIRANLMLGYIAGRWPRIPILWLQRHPLEVVNSQVRMRRERNWQFDWHPDDVLAQDLLMSDWLRPFEGHIRGAAGLVDRLACRWCVENYVAQRQAEGSQSILPLSFQALRTDAKPWKAVARLLDELELDHALALDGRGAPLSFTAQRRHGEIPERETLDYVTERERERVMQTVRAFDLEEFAESLRKT